MTKNIEQLPPPSPHDRVVGIPLPNTEVIVPETEFSLYEVIDAIDAKRQEEFANTEVKPIEFISGVTEDGLYVSVDENRGLDMGADNYFVIRVAGTKKDQEKGVLWQEDRMSYGDVLRFRDGGTTSIPSILGHFHKPSPFREGEDTTFNDEPIVYVDSRLASTEQ